MINTKRIANYSQLDDLSICYWPVPHRDSEAITWLLYIPGCGVGALSKHQVVEHEDGTISVTPSILRNDCDKDEKTQRHGFLTRGIWVEC